MTIRLHILATVTALAGQLVGVVGMPLPSAAPEGNAPATANAPKAQKTCHCACGGGCGTVCCCCGESSPSADEPANPPTEQETAWHWVASIQMQKCHGVGVAGAPDLPPALLIERSVLQFHANSAVDSVHLSPIIAFAVSGSPPTPPPRGT
jgi:hypothetical protein